LMALTYPLSRLALKFGPPEYFSLTVLGLIILIYLTQKSLIKAISMGTIGLILSFVGTDIVGGQVRFTCGIDELLDGVGLVPVAMGLFGITEVFKNLEIKIRQSIYRPHIKGLLPNRKDWSDSIWPILRGTAIGFFLGTLPGGGAALASFVAYGVEKRVSKHPEKFGTGIIEGVASPESANNAASSSAFIPLMTLGIPSNVIMGMLFAGLVIHSITPGPLLLQNHPDVFWGVIASMYFGNVILLVLNLPLIGMWVQITKIPLRLLFPIIIVICVIGVYSLKNSVFDLWVMIVFGIVGYIMGKCGYEPAPLLLAYILGPMLEQGMRQSLLISNGSFWIFVSRPISVASLLLAFILLLTSVLGISKKKRLEVINQQ